MIGPRCESRWNPQEALKGRFSPANPVGSNLALTSSFIGFRISNLVFSKREIQGFPKNIHTVMDTTTTTIMDITTMMMPRWWEVHSIPIATRPNCKNESAILFSFDMIMYLYVVSHVFLVTHKSSNQMMFLGVDISDSI